MSWSLNEIGGLTRKAARGAGFSWGMAEEAGRAARWLAGVGLPGAEALADLLEAQDGVAHDRLCPANVIAPRWQAVGGTLCPIATGAALCDLADMLDDTLTLDGVAHPVLLVPFLAATADTAGRGLTLDWPGATFHFGADLRGRMARADARADTVRIRPGAAPDLPPLACQLRYDLCPDVAARLTALAQRTYAPETDALRLGGAGAGLSDND